LKTYGFQTFLKKVPRQAAANKFKQSSILSDIYITEIIQATSSGADESLYKFGGHLEFKTTDEALIPAPPLIEKLIISSA
jgi:hypothetical protein